VSHSFYVRRVPEASLKDALAGLAMPDLVVDCEVPERGWPALARVYQDRVSVRSVETSLEGGDLQVRILAASSPDDFALAARIVDGVAARHGVQVESEDSEPLPLEEWRARYGPDWQREQCRGLLGMVASTYQRNKGTMRMFGTRAEFLAGPRVMEPLLADPASFPERFFAAFRRRNYLEHEDVYGPRLMRVRPKSGGKDAIVAVLGPGVPTALSTEAGFVVLTDLKESLNVPFDEVVRAAGDTLTWIDDGTALTPAYAPEAWQKLVAAARPAAVADFAERPDLLRDPEPPATTPADAAPPAEEPRDELGLTERQWVAITAAPVVVFLMVAAADGKVDSREIQAFGKKLLESLEGGSRIMKGAAMRAAPNLDALIQGLAGRGLEGLAAIVVAARQIVDETAGRGEGHRFARACYALGESVASASGGGLFGFGNKIGAEERAILDGLKKLLRLP
jgi:hypothetical protein